MGAAEVSIRELRNHGGDVVDRVARGERVTVTRSGRPVAEPRPVTKAPLPFDADAARSFGQVAASLRRAGRKPAARAYDAMIAATAIANGLPVHTCNPADFNGIERLTVVVVPHPGQ